MIIPVVGNILLFGAAAALFWTTVNLEKIRR